MAVLVAALALGGTTTECFGQSESANPSWLSAELLQSVLRTHTPGQDAFIEKAVSLTRTGTLPMDVFTAALKYARSQPESERYYYFRRTLAQLLLRVGLRGETAYAELFGVGDDAPPATDDGFFANIKGRFMRLRYNRLINNPVTNNGVTQRFGAWWENTWDTVFR